MDDATAKRIAQRLREAGITDSIRTTGGDEGLAEVARLIQEAAEPHKPGVYFVAGPHGLHIESRETKYGSGTLEWFGFASDHYRDKPDGDIISGPHTCEELLAGVQH